MRRLSPTTTVRTLMPHAKPRHLVPPAAPSPTPFTAIATTCAADLAPALPAVAQARMRGAEPARGAAQPGQGQAPQAAAGGGEQQPRVQRRVVHRQAGGDEGVLHLLLARTGPAPVRRAVLQRLGRPRVRARPEPARVLRAVARVVGAIVGGAASREGDAFVALRAGEGVGLAAGEVVWSKAEAVSELGVFIFVVVVGWTPWGWSLRWRAKGWRDLRFSHSR